MRPMFDTVQRVQTSDEQEVWILDGWEFNDDGTPLLHEDGQHMRRRLHFPTDTLEWRAAEYGIDPSDTATLLDLVVTEFFMTDEDFAGQSHLYDGVSDLDTIRRVHLARCAKVKFRHRLTTRGNGNLFERVRNESPIHPAVVAIKADHVARQRGGTAARLAMTADDLEQRRVARWKETLDPEPPVEITHSRTPDDWTGDN